MFRIWGKIFKNNRLVRDVVVCNEDDTMSRTQKVFDCLDQVCYEFDLPKPIWLESSIQDFKRHDKVRFTQDNFIEPIHFDFLEFHVIDED